MRLEQWQSGPLNLQERYQQGRCWQWLCLMMGNLWQWVGLIARCVVCGGIVRGGLGAGGDVVRGMVGMSTVRSCFVVVLFSCFIGGAHTHTTTTPHNNNTTTTTCAFIYQQQVHVFDGPTGTYLQGYKGHQDTVTCLAFRHGTHTLLSGSTDRQVKIWSLDDGMYIDTLYGHQAEVLCMDMLKAERAVTGGYDKTCRVWKIPEESQLVFRAPSMSVESVAYVTSGEWVSGGGDGSVCLWSNQRKKPLTVVQGAHGDMVDDAGELLGAGVCWVVLGG